MSEMQALTQREVLSVLKFASDSKRNQVMILLAFRHGLRASEVCALKLGDVDLKNGTITIRRLKGSLKSTQDLLDHPGQPLMCEKRLLRACKQHPHCLKHSLGYFLVEQGVSLPSIQQTLGHKSLASTGVYLRVGDDRANKDSARAFGNGF